MGLFNFSWNFNQNDEKLTLEEVKNGLKCFETAEEKKPQIVENKLEVPVFDEKKNPPYKIIEGYKALTFNMSSFYGKMNYELNKTYKIEGDVTPCKKGYHFCTSLEDVITLFPPEYGNRYFKVRAEVPMYYDVARGPDENGYCKGYPKSCERMAYEKKLIEYKNENNDSPWHAYHFPSPPPLNEKYAKYVAKSIIIYEEVPFEEYSNYIKDDVIKNKEDYFSVTSNKKYNDLALKKWMENSKSIFSIGFAYSAFNIALNSISSGPNSNPRSKAYKKLMNGLNTIKDEPISQDIKVLIFLDYIREK